MNPASLLTAVKRHKHTLLLSLLFTFGISLFAVLIFIDQRIPGSDDTIFLTQTAPYHTVIDWILYRYQSWSGRIFAEGFVYIFSNSPLLFWRLVSIGMYALFCGMLFAYYKLFSKKQSPSKDYLFITAALALPFLANMSVFAEAGLWVTGSMVYFWISTLGLVAFYPITYYAIKRQAPHLLMTSFGTGCAIIAASSQEQVGAVLLGLALTFLGYTVTTSSRKLHKRNIPWYLVFFCVVIGASLIVSLTAPGNSERIKAEVITWLPDLYTTPALQRIEYGYRWLLEAFINHTGYLLVIAWVFMAALFAVKKKIDRLDYALIFILVIAALFTLSKGIDTTSYWLNFHASWKPNISSIIESLNLIPWGIVLTCTAIAPLVLFRKQIIGYLLTLLYLATIASSAILLLSPTMYASLWRSFFVPSVLLMIIVYILFDKIIDQYSQYKHIVIGIIISLAASHYIFQAARLLHNFHS